MIELEGGAKVAEPGEGEASRHGALAIRPLFGRATGARAVSLRLLRFDPGPAPGLSNHACDEVLYVLEGRATVFLDGWPHEAAAGAGLYLAPGAALAVANPGPGPFVLASSRCHDTEGTDGVGAAVTRPAGGAVRPATPPIVRPADREALPAGDRWYRVLVDQRAGSTQVTQFVGSIPPGRAPEHAHEYEEVLCILRGRGVMRAGLTSAPIGQGSCIYLPRGQRHCVENTGEGELRLLGVLHPAGSPAVRY